MTRPISHWAANAQHAGLRLLLAAAVLMSAGCSPGGGAPSISPTASGYPRTSPSPFWAPDDPVKQSDTAFGKLTPNATLITVKDGKPQTFTIRRFVLDSTLPSVPPKLPVYMTGVYPSSHQNPKLTGAGWEYVPHYALVGYGGKPLTPPSGDTPAAKAAALLKQYDLLVPDSEQPSVLTLLDGSTAVAFFRHVSGPPIYGDKPACVQIDANGQVSWLQIRRRPLTEVSLYPTMPPQEAWQKLQQNQYTKPSNSACMDGGEALMGEIAEFRVKSVELAYWEPHVDAGRQIMMPYYVFRNEEGSTVYVPAVADELLVTSNKTR